MVDKTIGAFDQIKSRADQKVSFRETVRLKDTSLVSSLTRQCAMFLEVVQVIGATTPRFKKSTFSTSYNFIDYQLTRHYNWVDLLPNLSILSGKLQQTILLNRHNLRRSIKKNIAHLNRPDKELHHTDPAP